MDAFSSIFTSPLLGQLLGPLLSVGVALFGLFIFWRRADSLHAIWEKVWRLVAGGAEVQEPRLRAFMQEMRDLEKFRLVYGLKISNMSDMHRLIAWVRRHGLDMAILQKARRWVDISTPEIVTLPSRGYFFQNGLGYFPTSGRRGVYRCLAGPAPNERIEDMVHVRWHDHWTSLAGEELQVGSVPH
ncbi:DUF6216 family protein [Ralstonia pseudosolanacearum]|nr:DUF6216 family protein [Ralstonia pseudosolanacearum]